jgi:hypothetical protein
MAPCPAGFGTIFGSQNSPAEKKSLTFVDSEDSEYNLIVMSRAIIYIIIILADTV